MTEKEEIELYIKVFLGDEDRVRGAYCEARGIFMPGEKFRLLMNSLGIKPFRKKKNQFKNRMSKRGVIPR